MIFKVKDREYDIKFGLQATANSGILTKLAKFEEENNIDSNDLSSLMFSMENTIKILAELLLIGLQKNYKDEFFVDCNSDITKSDEIVKVYDLLDEYFEEEDADFINLYVGLNEELVTNGFLSKMFREEQAKAKTPAKKATTTQKQ